MNTNTKKILHWIIINGLLALCAWLAINGSIGAERVFCFFTIAMGLLQFAGSFLDDIRETAQKNGRFIPSWIARGAGLSFVAMCAWQGWIFTGIAILLGALGEDAIYHKKNEN
jgi:hypothetical protein